MRHTHLWWLLLATSPAWGAGAIDSPACRGAMAKLQAQEDRVLAASAPVRGAVPPALTAARRQAAKACLGSADGEPVPAGRMAQPPATVPPVSLPRPAAPPVAASPAPSPRAQPIGPSVITSCDLTGCWTNDGTRLHRAGPLLVGPNGPCSTSGNALSCP